MINSNLEKRIYEILKIIEQRDRAKALSLSNVVWADFMWFWNEVKKNQDGWHFTRSPKGKMLNDVWIEKANQEEWKKNKKEYALLDLQIPLWEGNIETPYRLYLKVYSDDFQAAGNLKILVFMIRIP